MHFYDSQEEVVFLYKVLRVSSGHLVNDTPYLSKLCYSYEELDAVIYDLDLDNIDNYSGLIVPGIVHGDDISFSDDYLGQPFYFQKGNKLTIYFRNYLQGIVDKMLGKEPETKKNIYPELQPIVNCLDGLITGYSYNDEPISLVIKNTTKEFYLVDPKKEKVFLLPDSTTYDEHFYVDCKNDTFAQEKEYYAGFVSINFDENETEDIDYEDINPIAPLPEEVKIEHFGRLLVSSTAKTEEELHADLDRKIKVLDKWAQKYSNECQKSVPNS